MASKKKTTAALVGIGPEYDPMANESIHMELNDIKKLKLGDYVEVKVCGYVKELRAASSGGYDPSNIGLLVEKRSVDVIGDEQSEGIKKLSRDEDDDEIEED